MVMAATSRKRLYIDVLAILPGKRQRGNASLTSIHRREMEKQRSPDVLANLEAAGCVFR
jgi:hypothetical protein